jgi:long-chain fatty acid transport protein
MKMARADPDLCGRQDPATADLTHSFGCLILNSSCHTRKFRRKAGQKVRQRSLGRRREWLTGVLLSLLVVIPSVSQAAGPIHGAKAAAMGTAFVGLADDPSAIIFNPAGLANLQGTNLYGGGTAVILSSEFKSPEGGHERTSFQVFLPPHFYVSSDLGTNSLTLGLGMYSPFGIGGRKWPETGLTRYASTEGTIGTIAANPTVVWRVLPQVAVAAGLDILYAFNHMVRMVDQSLLGAGDGRLSFKGDGLGWGYNFGLLVFPGGKVSFGFAYRDGIRVKQKGTLAFERIAPPLQPAFGGGVFRTHASMVVHFPEIFSWGVAFRPTARLTLAADVEWVRWSSFDQSTLNLRRGAPQAGFSNIPLDFRWEDSWQIKFGGEYKVNEKLSLRAGYAFIETPVPGLTLNPGNPDSDQHNITVGFGYKIRQWNLDFFYIAGFFHDRRINNAILSGTYQNFAHYGGFSVGQKF